MLILYITYIDFGEGSSGSGVRPQKMYEAFLQEGHEVKLLSGGQGNYKTRQKRLSAVAEIEQWLNEHKPDLCYIESPVYPILWGADRRLIARIHRMRIPIGYFYRDLYRKFPDLFPRRRDLIGAAKELYLDRLQAATDRLLEKADIVYFPSEKCFSFFSYADMRTLPPGGEDRLDETMPFYKHCVYVGGLMDQYDGECLLQAFALLNKDRVEYPLTLICRHREWQSLPAQLRRGPWLEVHHVSGEALRPLLSRAGAGLLIGKADHPYSQYAVSVKTYEYMGYGLPMVYIRNAPHDRIIEAAGIGIGTDGTPEALAEGIRRLFASPEVYERYRDAAAIALYKNGLWVHRARQVVRDLTEKRKS